MLAVDAILIARKHRNYVLRRFNKWYVYIPSILVILFVLNVFMANRGVITGFDNHRNVSMNMAPNLLPGDLIATDTRQYVFDHVPDRGEIITFKFPRDESIIYVKRVLGLPSENISIKDGILYINGETIAESYVQEGSNVRPYSQNMEEITVPENHVFVLGDNRDNSNDSRFWGMLPISNVNGKVTLIWYANDTSRIKKI
ncbi:MAG: signal peptidase I [Candidatus Thiodiazotropha sp. (ex Lucinoma kastoroae)]|nr:signal peptidase I [Candidatus Thiodiazotropha sp. (ex Lucinoma kastoroae)]